MKKQEKQVLVGFRVDESFHRRIENECLQRRMTLKQLATNALHVFFGTPRSGWDQLYVSAVVETDPIGPEEAKHRLALAGLWVQYVSEMPEPKVTLMAEVMKLDLENFRSSRRKNKKRTPKELE